MKKRNEYTLGLYEKAMPSGLPMEEKLAQTGRGGFDFMEISIDESEEKLARLRWRPPERQEVIRAMWKTGIPILTMCLSGHRKFPLGSESPGIRKRGMEIMAEAIRLARDLGIRIIQIAGYDEFYNPSTEETRRLFGENLEKAVRWASREGVVLAFETMETDFINTVSKAMDHVRRINSPYLQIYPDIGNITNAALKEGRSPLPDLAAGRGHIAAMHLKETLPGCFREVPFGEGHVDFRQAAGTAGDLGVSLFVGEFWHRGETDWPGELAKAAEFLRRAIDPSKEGAR